MVSLAAALFRHDHEMELDAHEVQDASAVAQKGLRAMVSRYDLVYLLLDIMEDRGNIREVIIEVRRSLDKKRGYRFYSWGIKQNLYRKLDDEQKKQVDELYEERKEYLEKYFYERRDGLYSLRGGKQVINRENSDYTVGELDYTYISELAKDITISEATIAIADNITDKNLLEKYMYPLAYMIIDPNPTYQALKVVFAHYLFWNKSCKNRTEAAERCGTTLERMKEYKKYYKEELYRLYDLLLKYPILRDDLFGAYNVIP